MGPRWAQASRDMFQYYNWQAAQLNISPACLSRVAAFLLPLLAILPLSSLHIIIPTHSFHQRSSHCFLVSQSSPDAPMWEHVWSSLGWRLGSWGVKEARPSSAFFLGHLCHVQGLHPVSLGLCWNSSVFCGRPASPHLLDLRITDLGQPFLTFPLLQWRDKNGSVDKKISTEFFDFIHAVWVAVL